MSEGEEEGRCCVVYLSRELPEEHCGRHDNESNDEYTSNDASHNGSRPDVTAAASYKTKFFRYIFFVHYTLFYYI